MITAHPELNAAELRAMASRLMLLAEQQNPEPDEGTEAMCEEALFGDLALAKRAREELELRRSRQCFLDEDLFGEPTWDMLLELFVANVEAREISVTSCCVASGAPRSTALRYLILLEERGLVRRHGSETDGRVQHLHLTHAGLAEMRKALRHYCAIRIRREPGNAREAVVLQFVK